MISGDDSFCHENIQSDQIERGNRTQIFFLETSGECCLTPRQACSVESAIRTNPDATISLYMNIASPLTVHMRKKGYKDFNAQKRSCSITNNLFKIGANSRLVREDLLLYLNDTPLWGIIENELLEESLYPFSYVSDMVRVAMLWKYGGVYLDLDCIVLKRLDSLRNAVGLNDLIYNWVENGVMAFESKHYFLLYLMNYMIKEFRPNVWMSMGPSAMSNAIVDFCDEDHLVADKPMTCKGNVSLTLQSYRAFYALGNRNNDRDIFYRSNAQEAIKNLAKISDSFVSHVYNAELPDHVPEDSLYALLGKKFCPLTYYSAIKEGAF